MVRWAYLRATVYKIYVRLDLTFFHFSSYLCFILLYFMSYVKYWSKVEVDSEFWNTTHFVFLLIYNNHISITKRINADILLYSNAHTFATGSFSVYFPFSESRFFYYPLPINGIINRPKLCFKFQNSLKVIEYTLLNVLILKLNIILLPRQIVRAVKVRAIWWGKEPCSFEWQSIFWWNIENWRILIPYVLFSFQVDLHLFLPLLN